MKEIIEWDNNPRLMWVWDNEYKSKIKAKVIYIQDCDVSFKVVAINDNDGSDGCVYQYKHCAEIEAGEYKRMTYHQLARWLSEKPYREFKDANYVYPYISYKEDRSNEEVPEYIKIRENDGEWLEPIVPNLEDEE
ncbi:hypothetical protein HDR60_03215 [bacterium]|nr:hypothetical protein [bacterium]